MTKIPGRKYKVKSGDSLSKIAQRYYGDPSQYKMIAEVNNIADPNRISIGQTLTLPKTETYEAPRPTRPGTLYEVKKGDTLWGIAASAYGPNPQWMWPEIAKINPDIKNPDLIYPGQKLYLPVRVAPRFDQVYVDESGRATVSGKATPGSKIDIVSGENSIATTEADEEGRFEVVITDPLPAGDHQITIAAQEPQAPSPIVSTQVAMVMVSPEPEQPARVEVRDTAEEPEPEQAPEVAAEAVEDIPPEVAAETRLDETVTPIPPQEQQRREQMGLDPTGRDIGERMEEQQLQAAAEMAGSVPPSEPVSAGAVPSSEPAPQPQTANDILGSIIESVSNFISPAEVSPDQQAAADIEGSAEAITGTTQSIPPTMTEVPPPLVSGSVAAAPETTSSTSPVMTPAERVEAVTPIGPMEQQRREEMGLDPEGRSIGERMREQQLRAAAAMSGATPADTLDGIIQSIRGGVQPAPETTTTVDPTLELVPNQEIEPQPLPTATPEQREAARQQLLDALPQTEAEAGQLAADVGMEPAIPLLPEEAAALPTETLIDANPIPIPRPRPPEGRNLDEQFFLDMEDRVRQMRELAPDGGDEITRSIIDGISQAALAAPDLLGISEDDALGAVEEIGRFIDRRLVDEQFATAFGSSPEAQPGEFSEFNDRMQLRADNDPNARSLMRALQEKVRTTVEEADRIDFETATPERQAALSTRDAYDAALGDPAKRASALPVPSHWGGTVRDLYLYTVNNEGPFAGRDAYPLMAETEQFIDDWYLGRMRALESDKELDEMYAEEFAQLPKDDPRYVTYGLIGDVWRAVKGFRLISSAEAAEVQPSGQDQEAVPQAPSIIFNTTPQQRAAVPELMRAGEATPDQILDFFIQNVLNVRPEDFPRWGPLVPFLDLMEYLGTKQENPDEVIRDEALSFIDQLDMPQSEKDALKYNLAGVEAPLEEGYFEKVWRRYREFNYRVAVGAVDAAGQAALGGPRDALQSSMNAIDDVRDVILSETGVDVLNPLAGTGAEDTPILRWFADEVDIESGQMWQLPELIDKPTTPAGTWSRGISQFLVTYRLAGILLSTVGWSAPAAGTPIAVKGARVIVQGMLADFLFADAMEGHLADMMRSLDWPIVSQNAVIDFLHSDENSYNATNRAKRALEGVIPAVLIPAFISSLRFMRGVYQKVKTYAASGPGPKVAGEVAEAGARTADNQLAIAGRMFSSVDDFLRTRTSVMDDIADLRSFLDDPVKMKGFADQAGVGEEQARKFIQDAFDLQNARISQMDDFMASPEFRKFSNVDNLASQAEKVGELAKGDTFIGNPNYPVVAGTSPEDIAALRIKMADAGLAVDLAKTASSDEAFLSLLKKVGYVTVGGDGMPMILVNPASFSSPDDILQIVRRMADMMDDAPQTKARITWKQTRATAGRDYLDEPFLKIMGQADPTGAINHRLVYSMNTLLEGTSKRLAELTEIAADAPTAENLVALRQMQGVVAAVKQIRDGVVSEAGRTLRAVAAPIGDDALASADRLIKQMGGLDVNTELARTMNLLKDDPVALAEFAQRTSTGASRSLIFRAYYFSLLSSVYTHMRNVTSNSTMIPMRVAETYMAESFNKMIGRTTGVQPGETLAMIQGLREGSKNIFTVASKSWKAGESVIGGGVNKWETSSFRRPTTMSSEALKAVKSNPFASGVDYFLSLPNRALVSADDVFKSIHIDMTRWQVSHRKMMEAINGGQFGGLANPNYAEAAKFQISQLDNPAILAQAKTDAAYWTFTTPLEGPIAKALSDFRRSNREAPEAWKTAGWDDIRRWRAAGIKAQNGFGAFLQFVFPFVTTPTNIFKVTMDHTPFAALTRDYKRAVALGGASADLARSKMALGTIMMMVATDLAMEGRITGAGPANRAERETLMATGWRPYSIKIGDAYYSYQGLEPLATLVGWAGTIGEIFNNADISQPGAEAPVLEAVSRMFWGIVDNVTDKTYLRGFSDLVTAISDPNGYGWWLVQRWGSNVIPNVSRDITKIFDPYRHYPYAGNAGNWAQTTFGEVLGGIMAKIPGVSSTLPVMRDIWGRPSTYESGLGLAYDILVPFYRSEAMTLKIADEMKKYQMSFSLPQRAVVINGERVDFSNRYDIYSRMLEVRNMKPSELMAQTDSQEIYFAAQSLMGNLGDLTLLEAAEAVVTGELGPLSDAYQRAQTLDQKRAVIQKLISTYQGIAKAVIIDEYPILTQWANQMMEEQMVQ